MLNKGYLPDWKYVLFGNKLSEEARMADRK